MKKIVASAVIILAMSPLFGCATSGENQALGIGAGAVVGGVAGNYITGGSVAGTAIGAAGGALVGNELAK